MQNLRRTFFIFTLLAASLTHAQEADLAVGKSGPDQAAVDTDVTYVVTVMNNGPDGSTLVDLTDAIPAGMTFVSATQDNGPAFSCATPPSGSIGTVTCSIATFAAGATANFTFVFHISPGAEPGTFFTNIATASSGTLMTPGTFDPNDENNSGIAVTSTPPPPFADLFVNKSGPQSASPDSDVVYTISLTNAGPDAASNVLIEDTLPATMTFVSLAQNSGPALTCTTPAVGGGGDVECSAAAFPADATATFTLTAHIPADASAGASFTNTAIVSSDNDETEENNSSTVTTTVSSVDVSVVKTGPATANAGDDLTYTLTVSNAGPDTAVVNLFDPTPAGTTFVSMTQNNGPAAACGGTADCTLSLGSGASAQFTLVLNVGDTAEVTNTATVTTEQFDTDPSDDEDSVTTVITPVADVSVTKSGPATVSAGTNVTYTITVANAGPTAAATVSLTDTVPTNTTFVSGDQTSGPEFICSFPSPGGGGMITCNIASFPADATATFSVTVQVPAATAAGTIISNTADVSTATNDPGGPDRTSTTTATVGVAADVSVAKSGPATVIAGTNVTYTVTVTNSGPSDAASVSLTDTLPAGTTFASADETAAPAFDCVTPAVGGTGTITCTAAAMPPATATFQFVFLVSTDATSPISNTAEVSSPTDSTGGNNSSAAETAVLPASADVSIDKTANGSTFGPGSSLTYTIVVTNIGSFPALGTTVTDVLPGEFALTSATSTQGTCAGTTTVICTVGTLEPAASATITLVGTLTSASGGVSNTATVTATNDIDPSNDSDTVVVSAVAGIPTLSPLALLMLGLLFASGGMFLLRNR